LPRKLLFGSLRILLMTKVFNYTKELAFPEEKVVTVTGYLLSDTAKGFFHRSNNQIDT
jgi:hypothetical protein